MDSINRWRKPPANGQGSPDGEAQPVTPAWPAQPPQNGSSARDKENGGDSAGSLDPPWERDSGHWPVPPEARKPHPDDAMLENPYMESLIERSLPSMSLNDYMGTGKIAAMPILRPGSSWSRGLRAPRPGSADASAARSPSASEALAARAGVEVDEQPSMHIAAMRSSTLLRATTIVSAALLISRVFGMLRTSLFAAAFAYGATTDAYTLAFTLPDAIFNIVAGGALASAIIPVFNDYMVRRKDRAAAWRVASIALNTAMIALVAFCVIAIIFTEPVMRLAFGDIFTNCGAEGCYGPLAVQLTRIMLLQPIFLGGATVAIALLQARQSFLAPAIGQVVYTVTVVGGIGATLLDNRYGMFGGHLDIYGPTWGVVIGAVLQFLIQIPGLIKAKIQYTPAVSVSNPGIIEIARLMGPRVLNSSVLYTSVFINRFLLTGLAASGVLTGYNTAFSLIQLPNGVIGMALAQAAFPTLSTLVSAGEWDRLRQNVLRAIQAILFLAIPSSLGLIVLAKPISTASARLPQLRSLQAAHRLSAADLLRHRPHRALARRNPHPLFLCPGEHPHPHPGQHPSIHVRHRHEYLAGAVGSLRHRAGVQHRLVG